MKKWMKPEVLELSAQETKTAGKIYTGYDGPSLDAMQVNNFVPSDQPFSN